MNVTLDQAIEMHARALKLRNGGRAPVMARARALRCTTAGDEDGRVVWLKVATAAEALLGGEDSNRARRLERALTH